MPPLVLCSGSRADPRYISLLDRSLDVYFQLIPDLRSTCKEKVVQISLRFSKPVCVVRFPR